MKNSPLASLILAIAAAVGVAGCLGQWSSPLPGSPTHRHDVTLTLFGAASTGQALDEIVADFQRLHGVRVETSFAASSMLAQQIANGARVDVFVSANEMWVDSLEEQGLVAKREDLLGNRLVVVLPSGSTMEVRTCEGLLDDGIRHVAMAEPEAVPAGIYARQSLERLGLWTRIKPKVAAAGDVRQALAFVETGAAEAGIVYATDAALSDAVTVAVQIDPKLTEPIRYPVVLLAQSKDRRDAETLYRYLTSAPAADVFRRHGFTVLAPETAQAR